MGGGWGVKVLAGSVAVSVEGEVLVFGGRSVLVISGWGVLVVHAVKAKSKMNINFRDIFKVYPFPNFLC
jgi:hypothetical protein